MFADSMLETSWAQRRRRSWTTLTSFGLQAVVIGVLLMIPLLTTVGLPSGRTVSTPISMGRRDPELASPPHTVHTSGVQIIPYNGPIMAPRWIPTGISKDGGSGSPGPNSDDRTMGDLNFPIGSPTGIPLPMSGSRPIMPVAAVPTVRAFRTSSMLQGSLIRRVDPVYPPLARTAHIQGLVVLSAIISKAGNIEHLQLISGHPMLVPAAIEAVSQWRYKPCILNGEVIEVETQITVNFRLWN